MPDQDAEDPSVVITPIDVGRYKHADPNRNPATVVHVAADQNRKNQMRDCPETTVLMRLSQFHKEELLNLADDFDSTHKLADVIVRWFAFHAAAGTMPVDGNMKKSWLNIKEKLLSDAWVRGHFVVHSPEPHR